MLVTLRTFPIGPGSCDSIGIAHPVGGRLDGSIEDSTDPVWIVAEEGARLSILWPAGFTAQFGAELTLYSETGAVVARSGDLLTFSVERDTASGTYADPYYAAGAIFLGDFAKEPAAAVLVGCYPLPAPSNSLPH